MYLEGDHEIFIGERVLFSRVNVISGKMEVFRAMVESKAVLCCSDLAKLGQFPKVTLLLYM